MRTSVAAVIAVIVAVLGIASTAAAPADPPPLVAIAVDGPQGHLALLDRDTLRPLATSELLTNGYASAPVLSPDGLQVAIGSSSFLGIRIVDLASLRRAAEIRVPGSHVRVVATAWPAPERLLVAAAKDGGIAFATIDPNARAIRSTRTLRGLAVAGTRTKSGIALLLAPVARIGAARLAIFEPTGLRVVALPVRAGREWRAGSNGPAVGTQLIPALAVDREDAHAYVFTPTAGAVDVDLRTGETRSHTLARRSLSKALNGPDRDARWLGNGLVAVTGRDERVRRTGSNWEFASTAAGLTIVDVRTWKARLVDRQATWLVVGRGLLLARGYTGTAPTPLRAYDFAGRLRFELTDLDTADWVQLAGERVLVGTRLVDLQSGRVVRRIAPTPRVRILPLDGSEFPL